jgi:fucose permease
MNRSRLFQASCIGLIVTAMSFALRGEAAGAWASEFHLTNTQVGIVSGTAFWGFTLAMMFGGPLVDALGLGRIVALAVVGHAAGIALTIAAWDFWSLFAGTLIFGIANGSIEAACNPLIATVYPDNKTTKLNHFHVWFPGGIVIGGLVAYFLKQAGYGWRIQFATMVLPLVVYAAMFVGQAFPRTERVEQGVSTGDMFAACLRPGFLLMVACMVMTAATELGPSQWIPNILSNAGVSGILVLVWITGLMAVGRMFAGPFVHSLSPIGMLTASSVLSALGLYAMSHSTGGMLFAAATIFAVGVCFFWPTMLGFVAENYPKTGALGLAIMGGVGMLSASQVVPLIGRFYDQGLAARGVAPGTDPATIALPIQAGAGLDALGKVAIVPVVLTVIFVLIAVMRKKPAVATAPAHG